jgi:hypothetical protein
MLKFKNYRFKKKFLLNYLSPTSKGTNWYDSAPPNITHPRVVGRYVLQFHQLAEIISDLIKSKELKKIKFLDLGTGNGLLPELISIFFNCEISHGLDPFEEGEHKTSPTFGTRKYLFEEIMKILKKNTLDISLYDKLIKHEGFFKNPKTIKFKKKNKSKWVFLKKYIHEIPVNKKYNLIFAKGIDHIADWRNLIKNISLRSEKNSYFIIKHNSFFSYNGAHRYASTFIPWGHLVLSEKEYKQYVKKFHKDRSQEMMDFYYKGLSYPRYSIDELMNILQLNNWEIKSIEHAMSKNFKQQLKLAGGFKKLITDVNKNFKHVSLQELSTSRSMIIAKKIK